MTINYNRTGAERKALADAIADITGAEAKYLGAPNFAYQVDYFTIDRSGAVTFTHSFCFSAPAPANLQA